MKGKRFLDIKLLPSDSELAADELKSENTSTPPPSSSMSILSLSASILTMGYLGSSPTSSTYSTPSSISSDSPIRYSSKRSIISSASETAKRASNGVDRMEQYQNQYGQSPVRIPNSLMFVQDPCFVQLVTQEKEKKSDGNTVCLLLFIE